MPWIGLSIIVLVLVFATAMRTCTQGDVLDTGRMCVVESTKQYAPDHFTTILRDTETGVEYLIVRTQRNLVGRSSVAVTTLQAVEPAVAR